MATPVCVATGLHCVMCAAVSEVVELSMQRRHIRRQLEDIIGRWAACSRFRGVLAPRAVCPSDTGWPVRACRRDPAKLPVVDRLMAQFDCDGACVCMCVCVRVCDCVRE